MAAILSVSEEGRLDLPAEIRKAAGLERGAVSVWVEGGEIRLNTVRQVMAACHDESRFRKAPGLSQVQGGALVKVHRLHDTRLRPGLFQGSALKPAKGRRPLGTTGRITMRPMMSQHH